MFGSILEEAAKLGCNQISFFNSKLGNITVLGSSTGVGSGDMKMNMWNNLIGR